MSYRIATRYAKSLVDLAQEKGKLDEVYKDMKSIDATFESSRDLKLVFKSPIITADKKLSIIKSLFEGKISELTYKFLTLLIKKGREENFHETANAFISHYNVIKQITPVKITSAVKLDAGLVQSIVNNLKKKENLKEVELHEFVNPEMIGGFILQYGDKMIDSSVSRNLNSLRNIIEDDSYVKKYF